MLKMKGLSAKEVEIISWLEFHQKYFFSTADIGQFAKDKTQRYNIIKALIKKKRIVKLNKAKYYLIPIKAKSGSWSEHDFIIVDEACDGEDYFIGGWSAANYWRLTEQIPMRVDVFTTRRQGVLRVLNTRIIFRRTTPNKAKRAVISHIGIHSFRVQPKEESRIWLKSRN